MRILVLPGDGVGGPEIVAEAIKVLKVVGKPELQPLPHGSPLPEDRRIESKQSGSLFRLRHSLRVHLHMRFQTDCLTELGFDRFPLIVDGCLCSLRIKQRLAVLLFQKYRPSR